MDDVHQWRDEVGADLVNLLITGSPVGIIGLTRMPSFEADFTTDKSFSVVVIGALYYGLSVAHELGHNLGCHHHPDDGGAGQIQTIFEYAYGHRFYAFPEFYRTVMAYDPGLHFPIWNFSNPEVPYGGTPTGIELRNNARVIYNTASLVADYLPTALPDGTWVDVNYAGAENGTPFEPYNTVAEGLANVSPGASVIFWPGSSTWSGVISGPLTLTSYDGVMTIGQ